LLRCINAAGRKLPTSGFGLACGFSLARGLGLACGFSGLRSVSRPTGVEDCLVSEPRQLCESGVYGGGMPGIRRVLFGSSELFA
jgi:hypothetical protein